MASADQKAVFLDTNIFLHYKSLEQIRWPSVVNAPQVLIVIPPIVIRELNKHKDAHSQKRIRDRAQKILGRLGELFIDDELRTLNTNTEVLLEDREPLIDFSEYQLSREIQDDQLIASIIAFKEKRPDTPVVLVTSDKGLLLKAKSRKRHIDSVVIPDDYKLPEESHPLEKRNRELEQQVRILQNRIPDLKLCFANDSNHTVYTLSKPVMLSRDEIEHRMQEIRRQHPKFSNRRYRTPLEQDIAELVPHSRMDEGDIAQYHAELDQYYKDCETWIKYCSQYENIRHRTIQLDVSIVNEGTCPAENVDIRMHFPDGFELCNEDVSPEMSEPRLPSRPKRQFEKLLDQQRSPYSGDIFSEQYFPNPPLRYEFPDVSGPSIRKTNSYEVTYKRERVTHQISSPLGALYATFESFEDASSFTIDYWVHADNIPQAKSGQLHVKIEKEN